MNPYCARREFAAGFPEAILSPATPYVALATFPLVVFLAVNPTRFSWGFHHGFDPMPEEVRDRAESTDRYVFFIRDGSAVALLVALMSWQSLPAARVGIQLANWKRNTAISLTTGLLLVAIQSVVIRFFPDSPFKFGTDWLRRRSLAFGVSADLLGSFTEEFWIAFCLVAFRTTDHSAALAVAVTAAVFGALHYQYRLGGALSIATLGVVSATLFLRTGSLLTSFLFHFVGNLGSLYWVRRGKAQNPAD